MASKQNPATLAACGASVNDLAGASINPDNSHSALALQVARLTRRCAVSAAMAATIAPLVFGEVSP
jgi:hypothetical protein